MRVKHWQRVEGKTAYRAYLGKFELYVVSYRETAESKWYANYRMVGDPFWKSIPGIHSTYDEAMQAAEAYVVKKIR